MAFQLEVKGTPAQITAALVGLVGDNALETQVIPAVRATINNQFNVTSGNKGGLFVAGPLQLRVFGKISNVSSEIRITLQVIRQDAYGNVIGGPPNDAKETLVTF